MTTAQAKAPRTPRAQKHGEVSKFTAIHMPLADRERAEREAETEGRSLSSYLLQVVRLGIEVKQRMRERQKVAGTNDIGLAVDEVAGDMATTGQH